MIFDSLNFFCSKSITIQIWLFGYEMTDTVIAFCKEQIIIITSKKKGDFLRPITSSKVWDFANENLRFTQSFRVLKILRGHLRSQFSPEVKSLILIRLTKCSTLSENQVLVKKSEFSPKINLAETFTASIKKISNKEGKKLSILPVSLYRLWSWSIPTYFDVNYPKHLGDIGLILSVKEESEINSMKKASLLTVEIFGKVFKDNLMETIDADRKLKHTKMTNIIEEALKDKKKLLGVDPSNVESCYPAIIQEWD